MLWPHGVPSTPGVPASNIVVVVKALQRWVLHGWVVATLNRVRETSWILVSIARSNPTAFQAVRFERPVRPSDNGEDGGIRTKRARGPRFEVTLDLVYEISLQDGDRKDGRACARRDTTDMPGAGSSDYARSDLAGPHPHACGRASDSGSGKAGTVNKRPGGRECCRPSFRS